MSARVGLGQQWLHTDGAHLLRPPEVILLATRTVSTTATRIWSGVVRGTAVGSIIQIPPEDARLGVFTVHDGRDSFLASAWDGFLRVDPGCMTPADGYARSAESYFQQLPTFDFEWDEPDKLLLIDNHNCLHGRATVTEGDQGRVLERRTYEYGGVA